MDYELVAIRNRVLIDKLDDDEYVAKICKEDPDWNNCDVNPISKILEHDFFTKHISKENKSA